jgi:hypothetical protein
MRIGAVACVPWTVIEGVHAAAPADLDGVAQALAAGRLAHDAHVGDVAVLLQPGQHAGHAVHRARSSSPVMSSESEPRPCSGGMAARKAAMPPFMSQAPRP